jgi:hypothetical protein
LAYFVQSFNTTTQVRLLLHKIENSTSARPSIDASQ